MRIAIDMQGAQTSGSRNRGIGRYTLSLTKEMVRQRGSHEVILVLSGLFPHTVEPIRDTFNDLLPQENIRVWDAVGPVAALDQANESRRLAAEISREAFLAGLGPHIVLNTSLFEGFVDDGLTSIGRFTSPLTTAVILYDLIPLIHRSLYLSNPAVEQWYLTKLAHLRRADLLLAISSSSRQEAIDYLGFPHEKVVTISTACDSHFKPVAMTENGRAHLKERYGLVRPFLMYTGGVDHRKNIEGLIRAYAGLSKTLRASHQLAVVCSIQGTDRERLAALARKEGLGEDELVITGFVPEDDLVQLYNGCKLFVFPSWHEGFGLPALEAMACGSPAIGSNLSSIPEVIGREDALFDPFSDGEMAAKIEQVITNEAFRDELARYGLGQAKKFTWTETARLAWRSLEAAAQDGRETVPTASIARRRPALAYVSPLPPEQTGIADYSAELLPELSRHYEIEVVVAQSGVSDSWVTANCPIRDVGWFRSRAGRFERILYHFGNSVFHAYMFDLLREFPGVVMLHDFFLSGVVSHMEMHGTDPHGWSRALLEAHGWRALQERRQDREPDKVVWKYPCGLEIVQHATGVIVHSQYSRQLADSWYGPHASDDWTVVPHLRVPVTRIDRRGARQSLGVEEDEFVVCSFGILSPHKLNHRLLEAWFASALADDPRCRLVFVGRNLKGGYGRQLADTIGGSHGASRVKITGWADTELYQNWLAAADVGVQLRTFSRGETSGTVLDCMNYGLATVVNGHGSLSELPDDAVWMLPDEFSREQLTEALTTLWREPDRRRDLGQRARETIYRNHKPRDCAEQYAEAIERYHARAAVGLQAVFDACAHNEPSCSNADDLRFAASLANNFPPHPRKRRLFLDISVLVELDAKTGIQRVVRAILRELILRPSSGWTVEPIYATTSSQGYRYARRFTSRFLNIHDDWAEDDIIDAWPGDIFLGLDLHHHVIPFQKDYLSGLRRRGIKIFFVVYDLLPVVLPQLFPEGTKSQHERWLHTICHFDGVACISRATADQLASWHREHGPERERPLQIAWFHLGGDVENSVPTLGLPDDADGVVGRISQKPSFLTVGTLEPRKNQEQILDAFELLWKDGLEVNLVIIGKEGWLVESLAGRLRQHGEINKRLFWLEGISDEYLEKIYAASTCLIAASAGEGFGLPLVEAAQHRLPIIARDIPVFREVAGEHAYYYDGPGPHELASAVRDWMTLYTHSKAPDSSGMPFLTWAESADRLLAILGVDHTGKDNRDT